MKYEYGAIVAWSDGVKQKYCEINMSQWQALHRKKIPWLGIEARPFEGSGSTFDSILHVCHGDAEIDDTHGFINCCVFIGVSLTLKHSYL